MKFYCGTSCGYNSRVSSLENNMHVAGMHSDWHGFLVVVIDGKKISNVDRLSVYHPCNDAVDESANSEHDDYVLRRLLKKSG